MVEKVDCPEWRGCPFCGEKVTLWETEFGVAKVIQCKKCNALFVFPWNKGVVPTDLKEVWETRVDNG